MEKLLEKLKEIRSDVDFEKETSLVDSGILASFDIIQIFAMIEEEYDVRIPVSELKPENFNQLESLRAMIRRLE